MDEQFDMLEFLREQEQPDTFDMASFLSEEGISPSTDYRLSQPGEIEVPSLGESVGSALGKTATDVAAIPQLFLSRLGGGITGVGQAMAEISGDEESAQTLSSFQEMLARDRAERLGEGTRGALNPVELGANLLNIPLIAFTGGVGLTAMGAQSAGSEYHEARKEGSSVGKAAVSGLVSGGAEFAFSKLVGDAKVVKAIRGLTGSNKTPAEAVKFLASTGNREGLDELLTTISQRAGQELTYKDTEFTKDQVLKDLRQVGESYLAGFAIGGAAPLPKLRRVEKAGDFLRSQPMTTEEPSIPFLAPDDALSQVRQLKDQATGEKLAREQATFNAIMQPLSQDDAEALREYEIVEQEEGRLRSQIESVKEQEQRATELYEELFVEGKWGLNGDTISSVLRGQDPKAVLIGDMVRVKEADEDQVAAFAARVKTLAAENPEVAESVSDMILSDGVTKETVAALEALEIKSAQRLMGEEASKTRFLSEEAELEQMAALGESLADSAIEQSGGDVARENIMAETQFAELAGMNLLQAQEALSQMRQAEHESEMILFGDPSRIDSPQAFAAQRVELESQLQDLYVRRETLKATMAESRQEALSRIESGVEAESAVERLRQKALEISGSTGDFSYFDRFDIESRRMGKNPARTTQSRMLTDAVSEHRDVMYAVLPAVERRVNRLYDMKRTKGNLPRNEIGEVMTREEFVLQETNTFLNNSNEQLGRILKENSSKPQGETVRVMDSAALALLRRYRIKPESVGFRGDLAAMRQDILDEGAVWLGGRMAQGRRLGQLEASELVDLAKSAQSEGAPLSALQFIEAELDRRSQNLPRREPEAAKSGPQDLESRVKNRLESDIPQEILATLAGTSQYENPGDKNWILGMVYRGRMVWGRVRAQFKEMGQVGESNPWTGYGGPSITDPVVQWTDKGNRKAAEKLLQQAFLGKDAVRHEIVHKFQTLLADLDGAVAAFVKQQEAQGVVVHKDQADMLWQAIQEKYEDGRTAELPEPIRSVIEKRIRPELDALSDLAAKYAPSERVAAAIKANKGKWLFRTYGIFSDKSAVGKRLKKESKPYQELFEEMKRGNYSKYKEEALKAAESVFGRTKTRAELLAYADHVANERIDGDIHAIVRAHLRPTETPRISGRVVPTAKQENMIQRVLTDPRVQKLMGKETNFKLSVQHSIENLATDFAAIKLRNDLHAVFRAAGMISDFAIGNVSVEVNPKTYEAYSLPDAADVGKPIYMAPEVFDFFNAVRTNSDAMNLFVNRAISYMKVGALYNPGTFAQNYASAIQMLITAAPSLSMNPADLLELGKFSWYVADELASPGSVKDVRISDAVAKKFYMTQGKSPLETIRSEVDEAIRYMVDAGGEFAFEIEESQRALFEGAEKSKPGAVETAKAKSKSALKRTGDFYKRPDVMVKWLAYKHNIQRLTWLSGLDAPTDAIKRKAAENTLKQTQDPRTTIPAVRNLSRGVLGLFTFGFAGFTYQMGRNIYNSGMMAVESAVTAKNMSKRADNLEKMGNVAEASRVRAMAKRYTEDALERSVSTAVGAYFYQTVTQAAGKMLLRFALGKDEEEDEEMVKAIQHFSFPETRNQAVVVSKIETVMVPSRKDPSKMIPKRFVTLVNSGNMNLYDNIFRFFRALATPGAPPHERILGAAQEFKYLFMSPSMFSDFTSELFGHSLRNDPNGFWQSYERPEEGFLKQVGRAAESVAPTAVQDIYQAIFGRPYDEKLDPEDPRLQWRRNRMWRQGTGMGSYVLELDNKIVQRFREEYGAAEVWKNKIKDEMKEIQRKPFQSRMNSEMALKAKYEKKVEALVKKLLISRDKAIGTGLQPYQLVDLMTNSKEYGFALPKKVAEGIVYGYGVSVEDFLPKE